MLGLVLSGGGARGAYEAGVLRFLFQHLPQRLGRAFSPNVYAGSSIGAMSAAWVAAQGAVGSRSLSYFWETLSPDAVYNFRARDLLTAPERLLRRHTPEEPGTSLFDPSPLAEYLERSLPWQSLYERIDRDDFHALVVACTDVASGRAALFVDGSGNERSSPTARMTSTRIDARHLLASASIPFVFPPVDIGGRWFVDGSLRQNTPLSPAVDLGCDRVVIVGVRHPASQATIDARVISPTPTFLAGKAMNALMLDPVEEDVRRLRRLNTFLEWAESAYPGFQDRMAHEFSPWRQVRVAHIRPSEDLGVIAASTFGRMSDDLPWASRILLRTLAGSDHPDDSDLLSFLLYDRRYTAALEDLGYRDAERMSDELVALVEGD